MHDIYKSVPFLHWSQYKGFKFHVKPNIDMMLRNYYQQRQREGNTKIEQQSYVMVIYDKEYVTAYFKYHFADILCQSEEIYTNQLNIALKKFISNGSHI